MIITESGAAIPYQLKPSPYSSHSLILASLPEAGAGRRVLDVGCSEGYLARLLAERGYVVTGIECPGRYGDAFPLEVQLIAADLEQGFPVLPDRFDYVICGDILEHLRDPRRLLEALRGVLAPGGRIIASLPNSGHAYFRLQVLMGRFPQEDKGLFDRTHLHFYTWSGWNDLFRSAGFHITTVRCSGVPVGLALPRWKGSAAVRAMERLSYASAHGWKTLFAYQFIVTATPDGEV